jgi:hypothetical protein
MHCTTPIQVNNLCAENSRQPPASTSRNRAFGLETSQFADECDFFAIMMAELLPKSVDSGDYLTDNKSGTGH